jgi:hypothetical protein
MIGASEIMRLAGASEKALHQGRPDEAVQELLLKLASALTTLNEQALPYLAQQAESPADAGTEAGPQPNAALAQLDGLCVLLESQNLVALDQFKLLSQSLSRTVGPLRFNRLREAVENLDFQLGAQLLREALALGVADPSPRKALRA